MSEPNEWGSQKSTFKIKSSMKSSMKSMALAFLFALLTTTTVFAVELSSKKISIQTVGLEMKVLSANVLGVNTQNLVFGPSIELGKVFRDTDRKWKKSLTGQLCLGTMEKSLQSRSLDNGFFTEGSARIGLEQAWVNNPFGMFLALTAGHASVKPVNYFPNAEPLIESLGVDGYEKFIQKANEGKRINNNYAGIDFGISYQLDGMKFSVAHDVLHGSWTIGIKYSLW